MRRLKPLFLVRFCGEVMDRRILPLYTSAVLKLTTSPAWFDIAAASPAGCVCVCAVGNVSCDLLICMECVECGVVNRSQWR